MTASGVRLFLLLLAGAAVASVGCGSGKTATPKDAAFGLDADIDAPRPLFDTFSQEAVTPSDAVPLTSDAVPDLPTAEVFACGRPGVPCCPGNSCGGGACCFLGQCVAPQDRCGDSANICVGGACGACGGVGQPCCEGVCTASGARCDHDMCVPCGGQVAARCCAGNTCLVPDLYCTGVPDGACAACGTPGGPCCPGSNRCSNGGCCYRGACLAAGDVCGEAPTAAGTCSGGRCTGCGGKGQICCGAGCYDANTRCAQAGTCEACGGQGDLCCVGTMAACGKGLACGATGRCDKCGAPGAPCCPGSQCDGAGCCLGGRCIAATASCSFLGATYGVCQGGRCGCGKAGEICCPPRTPCSEPDSECLPDKAGVDRCAKCGVVGGACCDGNRCATGACCVPAGVGQSQCVAVGHACPGGALCGADGACGACGGPDQACCVGDNNVRWCSATGTACVPTTETCDACGALGQRCCTQYLGMASEKGTCAGTLNCAFRGARGYACVGSPPLP